MRTCNLCGFVVLRIRGGVFGTRCLGCRSTLLHRAMGLVLAEIPVADTARVYELSSRGAFVEYLKRRHRQLTLSEYFDDVPPGDFKAGVQCQDVQHLTHPDGAFDVVTSTEVFEHVPDDRRGFHEVHRVLASGGYFVFTVPLFDAERTVERAYRIGASIVHVCPPEYHRDRIRGKVLAYRNYGRDIRQKLHAAGFAVEIRAIDDTTHAISGATVIVGKRT
jgi:SAM-dependent methyltransferase